MSTKTPVVNVPGASDLLDGAKNRAQTIFLAAHSGKPVSADDVAYLERIKMASTNVTGSLNRGIGAIGYMLCFLDEENFDPDQLSGLGQMLSQVSELFHDLNVIRSYAELPLGTKIKKDGANHHD